MKTKVLALCSTFNRKEVTLQSLRSLLFAAKSGEVELAIFVVDDGSSDGTVEAVSQEFPSVKILHSRNLYWAGAMRYGFENIVDRYDFDFLFAFNDDVNFFYDCFEKFGRFVAADKSISVVVGETVSRNRTSKTYGARVQRFPFYPLSFRLIYPHEDDNAISTFNMNALFVRKDILKKYGFLHKGFIHSGADFDYGLMLKRNGVEICRLGGPVGICEANESGSRTVLSPSISRLSSELSIKKQPFRQRVIFCRRNGGIFWFLWILVPYIRAFLFGKRQVSEN